ncbi:MAG: hypothetical protein K2W85_09405 [Phycisphaerales bacterium]|nr:hypothetical protein [Phycisphaerales bacterium]
MSQFGMQMPAGTLQRGPVMNVYTGLLLLAVLALAAASLFVFMQGALIGPEKNALSVHVVEKGKPLNLGSDAK